jgi:undecaprenyl-diphosphatase
MTFFDSLILGIVEGITEFLPISSTGHMILASTLLGLTEDTVLKSFEIIVQLGAIAAVVVIYWKKFLDLEILKRLAVAFIPTGVIGFTIYPFFKAYLNGNVMVVVVSLALGGIALIAFELTKRVPRTTSIHELSYKDCVYIGLCQAVAIIPGVSRSAATIVGGELLGLDRSTIVEFSFLLAVPTMTAAVGYDFIKNIHSFSTSDAGLFAVGLITAFIVALAVIKYFLHYIRQHTFMPFGVYRILVAAAFWFIVR